MRVAVVGAGVSGLVVAHLLDRRHDVTVFESAAYAGGHTNTIRVDTPNETHHVDTGFIVFNDRNYPNFERLLRALGVPWQPSTMSFSVSDGIGDFEYSGASPNGLFANRRHLVTPWFHRMVADLARFNRAALTLLGDSAGEVGAGPSLGDWLERLRFSRAFIDGLIVPQASAVWSADPRQMWSFPARFLAEFFDHHGMLGFRGRPRWRTVAGGSRRYVDALLQRFHGRLRLSTPVQAVTRGPDHVLVRPRGGQAERFDEVVLATHSDQALVLLGDATDTEREILGAIPYQHNEAVLHTDVRMLPHRRRAWASWNYHLTPGPAGLKAHPGRATAVRESPPAGRESPPASRESPPASRESNPGRATVTYHMNRLQSLRAEREFCVTLNRTEAIDPSKVIRTIGYAHPVYTAAGVESQRRFDEVSGRCHTHFCGAYWGWGFHEDGVRSALRVAERLGGRL